MRTSPLTAAVIIGSTKHMEGANGVINRIVIHGTVSPCRRGVARDTAHYFQSDAAGGLAQYVVDPGEIIQCCDEDIACWHAPPNHNSIGIEMTDPVNGPVERWNDPDHIAMMIATAKLTRDLCTRHKVPMVWLSPADLVAGKRGVTSHNNVSQAWHQTDHYDPGATFPIERFMGMVTGAAPNPGGFLMALTDQQQTDMYLWIQGLANTLGAGVDAFASHIATAVVAALPPSSGGASPTAPEIAQAVIAALHAHPLSPAN